MGFFSVYLTEANVWLAQIKTPSPGDFPEKTPPPRGVYKNQKKKKRGDKLKKKGGGGGGGGGGEKEEKKMHIISRYFIFSPFLCLL